MNEGKIIQVIGPVIDVAFKEGQLPKILDAIPVLRGLDQAFTALFGDIDTADKIVLINEVLCNFQQVSGQNGEPEIVPILPNEQLVAYRYNTCIHSELILSNFLLLTEEL